MTNNKYHDIASEILEIVGPDNIVSAIHCATRLPEFYNGTYEYLKSLGIEEIW